MQLGHVYFFTGTIKDWHLTIQQHTLEPLLIESLRFLVSKDLIQVYGFVIMPNHIHLIWEMRQMNKKETPVASFMKFTAHQFLEILRNKDPHTLKPHEVDWISRNHNFWQRDSLAVELYSETVLLQKLHYIHHNPLQDK
jgi:REP element-mobilizing transposase RayT